MRQRADVATLVMFWNRVHLYIKREGAAACLILITIPPSRTIKSLSLQIGKPNNSSMPGTRSVHSFRIPHHCRNPKQHLAPIALSKPIAARALHLILAKTPSEHKDDKWLASEKIIPFLRIDSHVARYIRNLVLVIGFRHAPNLLEI